MKKCGIIGGLGPEATVEYYRGIVEGYRKRVPDGSYPELIINSINMTGMIRLIQDGERGALVEYILAAVNALCKGGADFALLSSNTPHIVFDEVERETSIPMISIVRETAAEAQRLGLRRCGLMGTAFTMGNDFYRGAFSGLGIDLYVPDPESQKIIHEIIFSELVFGRVTEVSRGEFMRIISRMISSERIDSMILGCTELPLILQKQESDAAGIPFLNTTAIHVRSAVDMITG